MNRFVKASIFAVFIFLLMNSISYSFEKYKVEQKDGTTITTSYPLRSYTVLIQLLSIVLAVITFTITAIQNKYVKIRSSVKRMKLKPILFLSILLVLNLYAMIYCFIHTSSIAYTGSMKPTFNGGETILISPVSGNLTGKIIVFNTEGMQVCHRVIGDNGTHVWTKGDANPVIDPWITPKEDIVGIVSWLPSYLTFLITLTFISFTVSSGILVVMEVKER